MSAGAPTWIPSQEFVDIYSVRRRHLANLGLAVGGLEAALDAASRLTSIGVVVEGQELARFLGPDGSELGTVRRSPDEPYASQ